MTRIIADIAVSFDGFVTGPTPSPDTGLGIAGEALRAWAPSDGPDDRRILRDLREGATRSGAAVLGRHLFEVVGGPKGWDDTSGSGSVISATTATHLTYDVFQEIR